MAKIRLTKEFNFEAAHALRGYDGACRNIHGHSYRFFVTVIGEPNRDANDPKHGMVIDFGELKRIVNEQIIDRLDHALVMLRSEESERCAEALCDYSGCEGVILCDYQPTCENMLSDFAERISSQLPKEVKLYSLKLHETRTSFAEWFASDNE
ncbi:MAG: 6-carboxytetrahydropterin synthase [Rikenellaceae bacterium]